MVDYSNQTAIQQLQRLDDGVRLVVVNPNFVRQHLLLNDILQDGKTVYVRFHGKDLTQEQLKAQLDLMLHDQTGRASSDGLGSLLLDECDRADAEALDRFLPNLVATSEARRIVVISRAVPACVINDGKLRAITRFVPDDNTLMLWDYTQREADTVLLEVRAFGSGRVFLNGAIVENWDGQLPRSLFFYLIDRGMTTRNDIFATFWPTLSVREATNVFHVTKRKISEVLGTDLTVYGSGFYRIAPHIRLSYDAIQMTEMVQNSAIAAPEDAVVLLHRAISLYRGSFLTSIQSDWVKRRREELLLLYCDALASLARLVERIGETQQALGLTLRALAGSPAREDLTLHCMRLYRQLGMNADALATYDRLVTGLKLTGATPWAEVKQLADEIRAETKKRR
jgi:DNA-binding SARP family transcriptional activator